MIPIRDSPVLPDVVVAHLDHLQVAVAVLVAVWEQPQVVDVLLAVERGGAGHVCPGLVGDDDGASDESAITAAHRELEEETGYKAETITDLGMFFSSPGMVSEGFSLLRAEGLTTVEIKSGYGLDLASERRMLCFTP